MPLATGKRGSSSALPSCSSSARVLIVDEVERIAILKAVCFRPDSGLLFNSAAAARFDPKATSARCTKREILCTSRRRNQLRRRDHRAGGGVCVLSERDL